MAALALVVWFISRATPVWGRHNRRERVERVPVRQYSCRDECPGAGSAPPTPAAGESGGSGQPGAPLQAPTIAAAPAGKTGIQMVGGEPPA